jgi:predicted dehydrogenase
MADALADDYGLSKTRRGPRLDAPALDYRPRDPENYRPGIGLIGCGGISAQHLNAYRHAGYRVLALCDRTESKALQRRDQFYPGADVYVDYRDLLARRDIEIVDIATHPQDRVQIIEDAIAARKHVLSQKPFVVDLDTGKRLVELADRSGVRLAVNQNGRWAPHYSYIRQVIAAGLLGQVVSAHFSLHWDHSWIIGTRFEKMDDLLLYDFAIHWFDLAAHFFRDRAPLRVSATVLRGAGQRARPPMLAQAAIEFDGGLATLVLNGAVTHGQEDHTVVAGTAGTISSTGPSLSEQAVTLYTADGWAAQPLEGTWFREGFHGAMGELLCAIEEDREPINNARENLTGLSVCFAAIASAKAGRPITPGAARRLEEV